ncbi:hypothetical protein ESY86_20460 [Subsaximicrobium wynnwilliamsii]|uniref:DUF5723 domain-containing protein n=1 Tax=Subsaximicrobium wynnwilliamsii TaxID=291179 RepID=A0A5C6Z9W6_9FLAO|nr:DUF5723 family protein [Subsaximicrobium wynnwilliamsii]TXD82024.1 hypothetical protein ESY87_15620 [Subsaximicrobium wynnwilliamsii]TXD86244.1 hypothetical protein ESY86_20460 [Subsaximicrobium wynnwilliamsii]TXE01484.1 hypothetical protein ESY88_15610 [Subsaximicrobium wynnwilliamsii]
MKNFSLALGFCFLLSFQFSHSQSYIGHTVDNYAGIHGVVYNPSSIVGSNFKADINLASASVFGGSDYFGINVSDLIKSDGGFDFEEDSNRFPSEANNFFINTDIVGPSFMFNLNKKSSIGIITRGRGILNLNNINGQLYENIIDEFDTNDDFNFNSENLSGTIHAWSEIGLSYGRILLAKQNQMLKAGVTLKYLMGAGGVYINSPGLQGQYTAASKNLTTRGFLNYGSTQGFDNNDIDFGNLSSGFGMDLGFTYQWHPNRENDDVRYFQDPYKLKVGLSITDIGSINYEDAETTSYDLNASVSTLTLEDDLEAFLDNNYNNTSIGQSAKFQLPTALHVLVDYRLTKKFLVSAQADMSLVKQDNELTNNVINTFTLAPRLETKWFSLYAPLSLRQYGDFAFGTGIRLGPLTVGSASVFSNLLSDSSKTTDVFVGLNIPIYRK